ncbi:MAG: glycosyltransferase, partial [Woeseiaceae bacterium]|nr:glycosyltransferase [Woeseiaceae bacterium]
VAALKAQAAGVPVIGFDAGGMREAVADGESGVLVPAEDIDALRGALSALLDDDESRSRMGSRGRQRMQKDFSIVTMCTQHIELYESVLNG